LNRIENVKATSAFALVASVTCCLSLWVATDNRSNLNGRRGQGVRGARTDRLVPLSVDLVNERL